MKNWHRRCKVLQKSILTKVLIPQLTILNSSNGISCLQAPVQSVSSSDVDEDEDEDEDDKTMSYWTAILKQSGQQETLDPFCN